MGKPPKLQLLCLLPLLVLKENIGLHCTQAVPSYLQPNLFVNNSKHWVTLQNIPGFIAPMSVPSKFTALVCQLDLKNTLGYTALMGVPSKLQP